jgi:hypothetical protein
MEGLHMLHMHIRWSKLTHTIGKEDDPVQRMCNHGLGLAVSSSICRPLDLLTALQVRV